MADEILELANLEVSRTNLKNVLSLTKNQEILNSSKEKDIVAFVGNTGAGKSTLIDYLVEKPLTVDKNDNIVLKNPNDSSAMAIGKGNVSQTLLPKFIECNKLLLYDLPGIKDNRGAAVNLANASLTKNILENAKTVRLVFVTSMDEIKANRGELFEQLMKSIKTLIPNQSIEEISGFVITKSPFEDSIDTIVDKINECTGNDSMTNWSKKGHVAKMETVFKKIINQDDRKFVLNMINSINQKNIENVNISAIFTLTNEMLIKDIYIEEMQELFDRTLKGIIDTSEIKRYSLQELENKISKLKKVIDDCKFDSSTLIPLLKTISCNVYDKALIEFRKIVENNVEKIVLSMTAEMKEKERIKAEEKLKEETSKQRLEVSQLNKAILSIEAELNSNRQLLQKSLELETTKRLLLEEKMSKKQQKLEDILQQEISKKNIAEQKLKEQQLSMMNEMKEKNRIIEEEREKIRRELQQKKDNRSSCLIL